MAKNHGEIERQVHELQQSSATRRNEQAVNAGQRVAFGKAGGYDDDLYGDNSSVTSGYVSALGTVEESETPVVTSGGGGGGGRRPATTTSFSGIAQSALKELADPNHDPMAENRMPRVGDRQGDYHRREQVLSPDRSDPFQDGGKTPDMRSVGSHPSTYADVMRRNQLQHDEAAVRRQIADKLQSGQLRASDVAKSVSNAMQQANAAKPDSAASRRRRWDIEEPDADTAKRARPDEGPAATPRTIMNAETPGRPLLTGAETPAPLSSISMWAPTPAHISSASGDASLGGATPSSTRRNRWDDSGAGLGVTPARAGVVDTPSVSAWTETPRVERGDSDSAALQPGSTPSAGKRRSRWDETPVNTGAATPSSGVGMTPSSASMMTPLAATPVGAGMLTPSGTTPIGAKAMAMQTPSVATARANVGLMTPEQYRALNVQHELDERNRPLSDDELDSLIPPGYEIMKPPAGYVPITPSRKLLATPTPLGGLGSGFRMAATPGGGSDSKTGVGGVIELQPKGENLPALKPDDVQYFEKLLNDVDESTLSNDEQRERKILALLLRIKNGTPPMRKSALRQITEKARELGAGPIFNNVLPLLMSPTLEDQERHLLVKTIDRVLYKLDDLVRPFVHKILVVIEPLLIDEDYYARVEGREIISNLAKAAGLATMISTMRPDIDNMDEYVRNTTARAFAVVASALGIPSLLPFLKAVCRSKKSWQARHTGIKIVQQIAILLGCAILPHLRSLVEIIELGLVDEQQKVRTITALALAALAEAAAPYGIESFDSVLKPLWRGIRMHRGKGLAAFLKAIGYLIPLMDAEYAQYYTREVMLILVREFQSPDEEMKKIVLKVVKQCCATDGVEATYIKAEVLPAFFRHFWNQRMAMDKRNHKQLVEATVEIGLKVGAADLIRRIVDDLKDESEPYRKMVTETIEKLLSTLGAGEIDAQLEERLIDGVLYAFQEQTTEDPVMLSGFGTVVNALGKRVKPYLPQICGTVLWRLNNKSPKVRQQAADLIARIAGAMRLCQEEKLMGHLGVVLYEYLGEEYPEVLGSILAALKAIVNVIGMNRMTPPIKDLLPRLTPILKNRHEKVQENCIDLVGRIADRGAEYVSAREWMRICFELLELVKAHKKAIRRAAVNTFGYIAKAIGPHDVLATLLNNLKVQERQMRVCTTVAIAIVAETCSPFTVLPALMNEYRVPELNVQNGVLKSLAFMFEYIGEIARDYVYAVVPLLEDALMERDVVHRQIAMVSIQHLAVGVFGFGCEDALTHLFNLVWPNLLENSPHVVQAFVGAVEGMRVALGPARLILYVVQGLFHPARKIRDICWKVFNILYIGQQPALVPSFPRVPDSEAEVEGNPSSGASAESPRNRFVRYELDYVL